MAPDYIVKPAIGSFGAGIRGPFGPLAPLDPEVPLDVYKRQDLAYDQRQRTVYDALGQAVWQVDGTGAVIRQRFDANGKVVERVAYAARVPVNVALTAAAIEAALATVVDAARDQRTVSAYDGIGRLTHVMNAMGAVTENIYDAAGNRVRQIQYATPVAATADPRSVQGGIKDRASDWVYDGLGRQIASVDPDVYKRQG